MFEWNKHLVCYVEGPEGVHVLLALGPKRTFDQRDNTELIVWHDGNREQAFPLGKVVRDSPSRFEFQDDRGRWFSLRPMTAEVYEQKVRAGTAGPELKTDQEVRDFYLKPLPSCD